MKITTLFVGKTSFNYVKEGMAVYTKRLSFYMPFNFIELPDLKGTAAFTKDQIREKEGIMIMKNLKQSDYVILLDERGESFTSLAWAQRLERLMTLNSGRDIVFVIGGAYGFSRQIYDRADSMLSLSDMTFSHQIVRVIFLEQLYRAFTIMRGEPYHHQ